MLDHCLIGTPSKAAQSFHWFWCVMWLAMLGVTAESYVIEVVCRLKRVGELFSQTILSVFNLCQILLPLLSSCLELSKSQLNSIRKRFETDKKTGNEALLDTQDRWMRQQGEWVQKKYHDAWAFLSLDLFSSSQRVWQYQERWKNG